MGLASDRRWTGAWPRIAALGRTAVARELAVLLLYGMAVVAMTYPLVLHLGDQLPAYLPPDQYSAYWQNWSLERTLVEGLPIQHSPYLFHPEGLDTSVQPRRWMGLLTHLPFAVLFGPVAGFNLEGMLGLLISAYAGYRLLRLRVGERVAAWAGGAFMAFYPQHLVRGMARPNTGHIEWMIVFAALLVWTLDRAPEARKGRWLRYGAAIAGTGLVGAFNAYVNLKIFILAGLFAVAYVTTRCLILFWADRPQASRTAFAALGIGASALLFAAPIYVPMATTDWLPYAIAQTGLGRGVDLASFVVDQPHLPPLIGSRLAMLFGFPAGRSWAWGRFYIGLASLFFVVFGLVYKRRHFRETVPWLVVALCFAALSLGTELYFMGALQKGVQAPYALVARTTLFRALRHPHRMPLVFLVGWGVLVGYGCSALIRSLKRPPVRLLRPLPALLCLLMLVELSPYPFRLVDVRFSPVNRLLAQGPRTCAVIDVPFGRQLSKWWMFQQTDHGLPIVEGMSARMPPGAYSYIRRNRLLRWLRHPLPFRCRRNMQQAIQDLIADDFCYILLHEEHRRVNPRVVARIKPLFRYVEPMYRDDKVRAYRLADLLESPPCRSWQQAAGS